MSAQTPIHKGNLKEFESLAKAISEIFYKHVS